MIWVYGVWWFIEVTCLNTSCMIEVRVTEISRRRITLDLESDGGLTHYR